MKRYLAKAAAIGAVALLLAGTALAAIPQNWYGGPVYDGPPALEVTAALVKAGGGAADFSFPKALVSMLGDKTVNAEVAKLNKQYGEQKVNDFLSGMTYAVDIGLKEATAAGVKLPAAPADLTGTKLASTLVKAGTAPDGTFWSGLLFDKALSHEIHNKVMIDININKTEGHDRTVHQVLNQAMYDVAHELGLKHVKLAPLH